MSLLLCGCSLVLVGAAAAGGYALSNDSVKRVYEASPGHVYDTGLAALNDMGMVVLEDREHGLLKGEVGDVNVTVTVKPLTARTSELHVNARTTHLMPSLDIAKELCKKIDERL